MSYSQGWNPDRLLQILSGRHRRVFPARIMFRFLTPGASNRSQRDCMNVQDLQKRSEIWGWPDVVMRVNKQVCIYQKNI